MLDTKGFPSAQLAGLIDGPDIYLDSSTRDLTSIFESARPDPSSKAGDSLNDGFKILPVEVWVDLDRESPAIFDPVAPKTLPITGSLRHPSIPDGAIGNTEITLVIILGKIRKSCQ